jgi:hypothetical protein
MDQLKRLGITRAEEIAAMSVGTKSVIAPLFSPLASPVNSDYRPICSSRRRVRASGAAIQPPFPPL